jgi:uncharacterized glyoxalase superfamily protein PhnB
LGDGNTQALHVKLERDIDGHCERARAAGSSIIEEPEDQFYGDRTYRALDLEGHSWTFYVRIRDVPKEEAEAALGRKVEGRSDGR